MREWWEPELPVHPDKVLTSEKIQEMRLRAANMPAPIEVHVIPFMTKDLLDFGEFIRKCKKVRIWAINPEGWRNFKRSLLALKDSNQQYTWQPGIMHGDSETVYGMNVVDHAKTKDVEVVDFVLKKLCEHLR